MESAEQRLFRSLQIGLREYACGMMTYDMWLEWQKDVAREAQDLGVVDKLVKLLDQGR